MTMCFKSYEHFHYLLTDGRTDSHSDYKTDPRVVQLVSITRKYCNYIYSNIKDTSDFHGTVSFDPIKMS